MNSEGLNYVLNSSGTEYMFVGAAGNWLDVSPGLPQEVKIISFPGVTLDGAHSSWDELISGVSPLQDNHEPIPDDLVSIIYTSGTTGLPKGVMHTHRSFANLGRVSTITYKSDQNARFLSYLPLSHIMERGVLVQSIACGGQVFFNESLETFPEDIKICQPTWFAGVARIWQKFQEGVFSKMPSEKIEAMLDNPETHDQAQVMVQEALGLSKVKTFVTGGGLTPLDIYQWYQRVGMPLCDVYGMTESVPATMNLPGASKWGTVGRPVPGAQVKISDDGEILTRTPCIMVGYYNDPVKTAEDLVDGWVRTGDKGVIDDDGYLKVTGRLKDIFKTAKGKYVAPTTIEDKMSHPFLEQLCLVGAGLPATVLLAELSVEGQNMDSSELERALTAHMNTVNKTLEKHARMSHILIVKEPWTVANGKLTHTLKLKRPAVESGYEELVGRISKSITADQVIFEAETAI
jgi:long-chain acyl-CoA synthetase